MADVIVLIAFVGILIQSIFIFVEHKRHYLLADILKGTASLMFVVIGYIGFSCYSSDSFGGRILLGLLFGMGGDVALNLKFVLKESGKNAFMCGIVLFLIGHILYLSALVPLTDCLFADVVAGLSLTAALLSYFYSTLKPTMVFKVFGAVYLGAVIVMTVMAIQLAVSTRSASSLVYSIGAVLFAASDIILIINTFGDSQKFSLRILNLSLYYVGQLLIAGSLFYVS